MGQNLPVTVQARRKIKQLDALGTGIVFASLVQMNKVR
jgi:hypothetical protein